MEIKTNVPLANAVDCLLEVLKKDAASAKIVREQKAKEERDARQAAFDAAMEIARPCDELLVEFFNKIGRAILNKKELAGEKVPRYKEKGDHMVHYSIKKEDQHIRTINNSVVYALSNALIKPINGIEWRVPTLEYPLGYIWCSDTRRHIALDMPNTKALLERVGQCCVDNDLI